MDTKDEKFMSYGTVKTNYKKETSIRIHDIKSWIEEYSQKNKPDIIVLEDIQFQSNQKVYKTLAGLLGVLTEMCIQNKFKYKVVPSAKWKSIIGIKTKGRNKEKEQSIEIASKLVKEKVHEDTADAICIAYSEMISNEK